jgi:hypothetical protein
VRGRFVGVYPTSDVEGAGVGFISGGRASTFELAFGLRRPKNTNINHPTSSPTVEKANAQPISVSNGSTERHVSTLPSTDSDHKSDLSRDSKDTQVGQMQVPPKEIQSRQNCFASTRSRTKVLNEKYFETKTNLFKSLWPPLLISENLLFVFVLKKCKRFKCRGLLLVGLWT